MVPRYLLFLADEKSPEKGEISFFDDAGEAATQAESLLEAGYEQDRIRIFSSDEMEMHVAHKPVVSLTGADSGATDSEEASANTDDNGASEGQGEVPGVKDGVRLSSMFKRE